MPTHHVHQASRIAALLAIISTVVSVTESLQAFGLAEAVKASRDFLAADNEKAKTRAATALAGYDGEIERVLAKLQARTYPAVKAGYHPAEHFSDPELYAKHPEDLLYFTVPKSYSSDRPTGLIVFLHGGGATSSRRAPRVFMNFPAKNQREEDSFQLGNIFEKSGMIAVGPSAPWNEKSYYRWCLNESDEYLADVMAECKIRFNIDPDRVFLIGHSMGGFGAYHHIQRQPDRFAAVVVNSGSWKLAYWPAIRGTPLCIIQGIHDAAAGKRWHYTDVSYARWTDKLLTNLKLDHTYFEHDGRHGMNYGKPYLAKFLRSTDTVRRDPYYSHITLASPVGFTRTYCFPEIHNRWLTLNKAAEGKLPYDELRGNGAKDFDDWRLTHSTIKRLGAAIDAINKGDNTFIVTTSNVARFTIWLHPRMIDVSKRVKVIANDKIRFNGRVKPALLTAIESYKRRHDWGLVYPMKIEVRTDD